jgi:hypothetical protein
MGQFLTGSGFVGPRNGLNELLRSQPIVERWCHRLAVNHRADNRSAMMNEPASMPAVKLLGW